MQSYEIKKEIKSTGYPSIDRPWLKYYDEDSVHKELLPNTIYGYLWECNNTHLNETALVFFERKITYKDLFRKIKQCADGLSALGIDKGTIVTIQTIAIPQTVVLLYALSYIGAVANFVYVSSGESEVNDILKKTESHTYFVLDKLYEEFTDVLNGTTTKNVVLLSIDTEMDLLTKTIYRIKSKHKHLKDCGNVYSWHSFLKMKSSKEVCMVKDDQLSVVMVYTGGTTGVPKAVVLTNRSVNALVFQYKKANMGFVRQNVFLDSLPPFIAFGITVSLHLPLCMGVTTVLIADPTPQNQGKMFFKYKPNYYVASPLQIAAIFDYPKAKNANFSLLQLLATGGDALPAVAEKGINDFLREHNCDTSVFQGYGMSELAATVCTGTPSVQKFGTVGIPLPNTNVKIIDTDSGKEVKYGQQGEVCINAPSVMAGYYNADEDTKQILRVHDDGLKWIHTGDIGVMDKDGFLSIIGRIKRIINIFDGTIYHKIYPKLLEEQLETVSGVQSAAIVSSSAYGDKKELIAFIVTNENATVIKKKLHQFVLEKFNSYEYPSRYNFIDKLPRTSIGKVDYRALERLAAQSDI